MTRAIFALFFLSVAPAVFGASTIVFSGTGGTLSGFANAAGTPTNGMRWGLVIDTAGDGFDHALPNTKYASFNNSTSGFINSVNTTTEASSVSDDYFWTSATFPVTQDDTTPGAGETGTQVGAITSAASAPGGSDGLISGITTGDRYAVIWFPATPAEGSAYGLFSAPSFTLLASGTDTTQAANFSGNDAAKSAAFTFFTPAAIPEPSRVLMLAFAMLGMLIRRRRA